MMLHRHAVATTHYRNATTLRSNITLSDVTPHHYLIEETHQHATVTPHYYATVTPRNHATVTPHHYTSPLDRQ